MIAVFGRIVGDQPLSPDLQRQALDILATLLALQPAAITADDHARWCGTISYEILTDIGARVPRELAL